MSLDTGVLPGIDVATGDAADGSANSFITDTNESRTLVIPMGQQWFVDPPRDARVSLKVVSGVAEVFGTELANDVEYTFQDWKFSLFAIEETTLTWRCTSVIPDLAEFVTNRVAANSTAKYVYNLHFALEKLRNSSFEGPKVIVLGEAQVGKTALCRTLCSYAIKYRDYQPVMVNLDPQEPILAPPGCLTATPVSDLLDLQSPQWGQTLTSGATQLHGKQPLVKNFGLELIGENLELYLETVRQLSSGVRERTQQDSVVQRSGWIVDTPASALNNPQILQAVIKQLGVDVIVVLAPEDEHWVETLDTLSQIIDRNSIIRIPPLTGAVPVDDVYKRLLQRNAIRDYFYGDLNTVLSPYMISVDSQDLTVWKPRGTMDLVEHPDASKLEFIPVPVDQSNLQHALVVITTAPRRARPEEVMASPILGFGLITEVNERRQKVKILLPVPGQLPNNALVLTAHRYLE
ncbi:cleavage polyadenylation factor subunit CLP1 KNAG_0G02640 [Huiozyma naganishii CBS 8797]|uniref:Polynucleotide 5'-hydroxyl-kinase GRC3 n=1 Tax=Huiozyma naganishii (strain ATCC MYA-139 / BCRC 22969 / CBS 8797 / KCTC 17520 / NBRC 10181 / NCYC 3082 / Yp74L-3) TaxID=1071383 RepID=J7R8W9_HUIN7|nr:hypothetical protein KNAG_0G02640 [Kazachstania naganishii CBS 8797]CCK71320.1 hypothetical protein KNAG_0G02640 [Kazachstania naganishii CBS 8797]